MFEQVSRLRRDIDETRLAIEKLLDEHRLFIDQDMAVVITSYVRALQLDFELAVSRGSCEELCSILEDVSELHSDTRERLLRGSMSTPTLVPLQS